MVRSGPLIKMAFGAGHLWPLAVGTVAVVAAGGAAGAVLHGGAAGRPAPRVAVVRNDAPATPAPAVALPPPPVAVAADLPVTVETPPPAPPVTTPAPAPARAPRPVATPRPRPAVSHTNYLTSDDGTLNTSVGTYSDCSGNSPVPTGEADILTCITGRLYFAGHNLGVFTPLVHMGVGSGITYWDNRSQPHHYSVVAVRPSWNRADGPPPPVSASVVAQFQTCATPDGSTDRILDAVGDPPDPVAPAVAPAPAPVTAPVSVQPSAAPVPTGTTSGTTTVTGTVWSLLFGGHR